MRAETDRRSKKEATSPASETKTVDTETGETEMRKVREGQDRLQKIIQAQTELLYKTHQETEKIRRQLETEDLQIARGIYAQVLQRKDDKVVARPPALHSVIVASKEETWTGEEVLEKVWETMNAKDGWVTIDKVRKVKDRKVIISCGTEEERRRVKERFQGAKRTMSRWKISITTTQW
ncbi:hypothetical protein ACJJTC_018966 [Scirpophaga incertulas]